MAVLFAARTIKESKVQTFKSQQALIREGQIDFQLDVLRELAQYDLKDNNVVWAGSRLKILAAVLPIDLVPLARACVDLPSNPAAQARVSAAKENQGWAAKEVLRNEIETEILQAVERLVAEQR